MSVDALTLAAVAAEFTTELVGARIDDVIQPTPHAVALQCWGGGRNRWLLASAHPQLARVHLLDEKPRKLAAEPPAFVMLLRKHLEGARVVAVAHPRWERLLEIGFARGPAAASGAAALWLIVETMGNLSNVILRDDAGMILGALRNVGAEVNRYRTIAPHVPYRAPPPQTRALRGAMVPRLDGERVTPEELRAAAEEALAPQEPPPAEPRPKHAKQSRRTARGAPTAAGLLSSSLLGFSREMGREVAARALAAPDAPLGLDLPWEALVREARALAALATTHAWRPTLVLAEEGAPPSAFAVYAPHHYPGATLRAMPTVNELLATYYRGGEWRVEVDAAKGELRHLLQTQRDRCLRKDPALREELRALDEAQRLREEADVLLAYQTEISAKQSTFTVENPFAAGAGADAATITTITIALDPRLSAVENANRRYTRYHKLQRAAAQIPPQIAANAVELARVEQLRTDLALAETPAEIAQVRAEVVEAGYLRGTVEMGRGKAKPGKAKPGKGAKGGKPGKNSKAGQAARRVPEGGAPLRRESSDGFPLLVGKNSRQNEEVTFHQASANDLWLHARGVPGAHVIVKSGGRPVPETTLREAAALAAYYSQARASGGVPVDYTEPRYVRHMKGGGPGMVIYERERTIQVAPEDVGAS